MGFQAPSRYTLQCEWGVCRDTLELMDDFYVHLDEHFWSYVSTIHGEDGVTLMCQWHECTFVTSNGHDLIRHLYFHGFHTKVKWLGYVKHQECNAGPCHTHQNRNIIPELPDGFKCCWDNCHIVADIPDQFYDHVNDHVAIAEPEKLPSGKMGFKCHWEGCRYEYVTENKKVHTGRHKLTGHMTTHTQERSYACPWCGNLYVNRTKLIDHFTRQIGVEGHNFQCTHCSRTFASERILKDHMRHHVNHYQCPKCAMTCPSPSALKHHIRYKHSSERPYACEFCDYRSKEPHDMAKHMELHQSDLTYHCQVSGCDYEVRSLQNLRYHYRVKHGSGDGKYYACHLCEQKCSTGYQLTHHLRKSHSFQWPPGHCRFRYKECEDGLYRLQIFRYESIELSKQMTLDDIGVTVDSLKSVQNTPSTSKVDRCTESTAKPPAMATRMNTKRKKKTTVKTNRSSRPRRVSNRKKKVKVVTSDTAVETGADVENTIGVHNVEPDNIPVLFFESEYSQDSAVICTDNATTGTVAFPDWEEQGTLQSWLSTGNVCDVEAEGVAQCATVQGGASLEDHRTSRPLQEISSAEEANAVLSLVAEMPNSPLSQSTQSNGDAASRSGPILSPIKRFVKVKKRLKLPSGALLSEQATEDLQQTQDTPVPAEAPVFPNHYKNFCPPHPTSHSAPRRPSVSDRDRSHAGSSGSVLSITPDTANQTTDRSTQARKSTCDAVSASSNDAAETNVINRSNDVRSKTILVNGKQVLLSHIEDGTEVDVNGQKHCLVYGEEKETGNFVYCLVRTSELPTMSV